MSGWDRDPDYGGPPFGDWTTWAGFACVFALMVLGAWAAI